MATTTSDTPTGFAPGVYRGAQGASEIPTSAPLPSTAAHTSTAAATNGAVNGASSKPAPYTLRNQALSIADLPAHSKLATATSNTPSLDTFLRALLPPALELIDTTFPKQWTGNGKKKSKPSKSDVKLYKWEDNRADQTWYIRRSTHANIAGHGTISWEELDDGLRVDHSVKEAEYSDEVFHHYEVAAWGPEEGLSADYTIDGFSNIDMKLVEMAYKLPAPLIHRVFAELVVSAKTPDGGLIVIQSPVNLRNVGVAFYSNDRNRTEGTSLLKKKRTIVGEYVSIERARTTQTDVIEWTMGTAFDAKGALPQWIQRSQIGSAIAKDVGGFTKWVMDKRTTHSAGANVHLRE